MGLDIQNRKDLVALYWQRAIQTKHDADMAIEMQMWNVAANRIYYSMFHAVTALFVQDGYQVGSHRGCNATLGKYYVLEGKLSTSEGRFFSQMETLRDKADYDIAFTANKDEILSYKPQLDLFFKDIESLMISIEK